MYIVNYFLINIIFTSIITIIFIMFSLSGTDINILNETNFNKINLLTIILFIYLIILNLLYLIEQNKYNISLNRIKWDNWETQVLLFLGIIGIIFILIANDNILLLIGIELYSFTIYILVAMKKKYTREVNENGLIYLILGSIATCFMLFTIIELYRKTNLISDISLLLLPYYSHTNIIYLFIILTFLFKIGTIPFQYWVVRVYNTMDIILLLYQSIIPKIFYTYIIYKWIYLLQDNNEYISSLLVIIIFITLFFGSINTIPQFTFKKIIAYSSIINTGFIFIPLLFINTQQSLSMNIYSLNMIQYIIIYSLNTILLFLLYIYSNKNNLFIRKDPIFYTLSSLFCLIICIFSLIGFPPLGGFYIKLPLIIQLYQSYNIISIILIFLILFASLVSSIFYLNLYNSIFNNMTLPFTSVVIFNNFNKYNYLLSISISSITILILFYPIYINYILSIFLLIYI